MFKESPDERGRHRIGRIPKLLVALLSVALVLCLSGCGLYSSSSGSSSKSSSSSASSSATTATPKLETSEYEESEPYLDERWPTTNSELLAIPEEDRWYNAQYKIGTNGTIAGPVKRVYQATSSNGQPVFIDIGEDYPSSGRAQVVIWSEYIDEGTNNMLNDIDHGNAWISVTGYISYYDGVPQINVDDGYVSYRWWTNVTS